MILPRLLQWLRAKAPGISLTITPIQERELPQDLRSGRVDLAIGYLDFLEADFPAQPLLTEEFICVARTAHPQVGERLSLKQFTALSHVIVTHPTRNGPSIDELLVAKGLPRRHIALRVPSFLSVPVIVAGSDLLATLPQRLAQSYAQLMDLRLLEPPLPLGRVEIRQHWHERSRNDPANRWLREAVSALCRRI